MNPSEIAVNYEIIFIYSDLFEIRTAIVKRV